MVLISNFTTDSWQVNFLTLPCLVLSIFAVLCSVCLYIPGQFWRRHHTRWVKIRTGHAVVVQMTLHVSWSRSRIDLAFLDPDPYLVLGMGIRIQEQGNLPKFKKKTEFQQFQKTAVLYLRRLVLWPTNLKYIFRLKFNFLWRKSLTSIRIETSADPQHWLEYYVIVLNIPVSGYLFLI